MERKQFVTVKEVAECLAVSSKTVYQWAELRKIPCYKVNGCLRFRLEEVLDHLETCKIAPLSGTRSQREVR